MRALLRRQDMFYPAWGVDDRHSFTGVTLRWSSSMGLMGKIEGPYALIVE